MFGGLVTRQEKALAQGSGHNKPHGVKEHEEGTSDWTVQYHNTTPWVSATRDLYSSLIQIHPGNLTEAETTVPQN